MNFYGAEPSEILLAEKKDEQCIEKVRREISDIVKVGFSFYRGYILVSQQGNFLGFSRCSVLDTLV